MNAMEPAVSGAISTPASARELLADRFLARVAALTPAQWGELDAVGEREHAGDPVARWRAAGRSQAAGPEWLRTTMTALAFGVDLVASVALRFEPGRRLLPSATRLAGSLPPHRDPLLDRLRALRETADAQPGGARQSLRVLTTGLMALWQRDDLMDDAFAHQYALVEAVIPLASLER